MQYLARRSTFAAEPSRRRGTGARRALHLLAIDAILVAATFGVFALGMIPTQEPRAVTEVDTSGYITAPVVKGDLKVVVHATGTVEPTRLIEVSTELTGTLKHVHVRPNDVVKAGDVLAELDPTAEVVRVARAKAGVAAALARLKDAEAAVPMARAEFERKKALSAGRISTQRDLDLAETGAIRASASVESLRAELEAAKADLKLAETTLAKTRVVSPVNGIVLRRNAEPGQAIAGSLQPPVLFRLAEALENMQIRVDVDEADAMKVKAGQTAAFAVQALRQRRFPAVVERIHVGPEIVQGVVTYKAVLAFDNRELQLKPGMTASADIIVEQARGKLLVPLAALRFEPPVTPREEPSPGGAVARMLGIGPAISSSDADPYASSQTGRNDDDRRRLIVVENGRLRAIPVVVGATDGTLVAVSGEGLAEGMRVAVDIADPTP